MDRFSVDKRSWVMSRIKGKNTQPEKKVRSLLYSLGFRFRLHRKDLPGTPDIVMKSRKTVIFVHGCFWHCHKGCKESGIPKTNTDYWKNKLAKNIERDKKNMMALKSMGWRVLEIWECETKDLKALAKRLTSEL